jgi:hypothetical protein
MKNFFLIVLLVFSLVTFAVSTHFLPTAEAESSQMFFTDDFEGNTIDPAKWIVQENLNISSFPAYGGSIKVNNSYVSLASNGSSFPIITSALNPFPTTGDFALEFDITYDQVSGWGSGLWVSHGSFEPVSKETVYANILQVWADTKIGFNVFFFENVTYKQDLYWSPFGYDTKPLTIRLDLSHGVYSLYLNGSLIATHESTLRPDTIGFGHPPAFWIPKAIGNSLIPESVSTSWSSFKIGSVRVLPPSQLSISSDVSATSVGNKINIEGVLTNPENQPISGAMIVVSCLIPDVAGYVPVTISTTDLQGGYSATWMPTATGAFTIKASWSGDAAYAGTFDVKNVSVVQGVGETLFLAESNSTLSLLSFNSTSNEIAFTVSGSSGTSGYVRFVISKSIIENMTAFGVFIDGVQVDCNVSSAGDAWQLYFTYPHSTHAVTIKMPVSSVPEFQVWVLFLLFSVCTISFLLYGRKNGGKVGLPSEGSLF